MKKPLLALAAAAALIFSAAPAQALETNPDLPGPGKIIKEPIIKDPIIKPPIIRPPWQRPIPPCPRPAPPGYAVPLFCDIIPGPPLR